MSTKAQQDFQFSLSETLNGFIELIITSRLRWLFKCHPQAKAYKSTPNVSEQEELNLHQSGLPFRQISALLLLRPHIFILLLSVLLLCWEISPFSWLIHRWGLPQSAWAAQLIELSCTKHTLSLSTHASAVCTCTPCAWYLTIHAHTSVDRCWKARIFLLALFNPTSYLCLSGRLLVSDSPLHPLHQCLLLVAIIARIPFLHCSAVSMTTVAENISQWRWLLFGWLYYWGQ